MQDIYNEYQNILASPLPDFRRGFMDSIDWNERLLFILGARGVGKTTLILQHIKEQFQLDPKALYVSMDDMAVAQYSIIEIAKLHSQKGGTHLYIDEIHKYENWSKELKNINDKIKDLHIVVSGSSALEVQRGKADLSRRAVIYDMPGLSFREYLNIETRHSLEKIKLTDLLTNHTSIAHDIANKLKPLQYFQDYLEHGFYPFYLEGLSSYHHKLNNVTNLIIESDMPLILNTDIHYAAKLRKLIYVLSTQVPFQPNATKLAGSMELNRATLNNYLHYLDSASILKLMWHEGKSYSLLSRPDKIYMDNPNLLYMINKSQVNKGTLRETFFVNQVSQVHPINLSKQGDFIINNKHIIEVGGSKKSYSQIADLDNSYIVVDETVIGIGSKIPLWLFGFLY